MIQTPCGKSITSVTTWNAAYASQHWKPSINSHQNTPPAFTLQKVSRGMSCQLHTGETIRWVCLYLRINRQNCRSNKKAIDYARVPFGWWSEGIPEGQMWKGPESTLTLTRGPNHLPSASDRLAPPRKRSKRYVAKIAYGHHILRDGNPHHLDAARFAVWNTDEFLGSGVCGVLTV